MSSCGGFYHWMEDRSFLGVRMGLASEAAGPEGPGLFLEHLLVARHRAPGDTPENQTDNKSLAIVELMV